MQPPETPFASFFAGGFESATHRRPGRLQIDVIRSTNHDCHAETDYSLLHEAGIFTVRDALRWHLIERQSGRYDWSSFLPMLRASNATGTQVIWDLCHWGIPAHLDIFSSEFILAFTAFAQAAATLIAEHTQGAPFFCPVNEISFWSWIGGDVGAFYPYAHGQADRLKRQLVAASLSAVRAIRQAVPTARFVQPEPVIHISANPERRQDQAAAAGHTAAQYQAWDWLAADPEAQALDIVGINYYWNNQWVHGGERAPLGHPQHRSFHSMLVDIWRRYRRPLFLTETGAEEPAGAGWLAYICAEVREAQRQGAEILGICFYPVMDYVGWDDDRHCPCGLIQVDRKWQQRALRQPLAREFAAQSRIFTELSRPVSLEASTGRSAARARANII